MPSYLSVIFGSDCSRLSTDGESSEIIF